MQLVRILGVAATLLAAAPLATAGSVRQTGPGVGVHVDHVRFWRGEGTTLLEGLVSVESPAGMAALRTVQLVVRDSAGTELYRESWQDSARSRAAGVTVRATPFALALGPGAYTVVATVTVAGASDSASVTVRSFEEPPAASDLLLSTGIRVLGDEEEVAGSEIRKGRYAIERGPQVVLLPPEPVLWYYLELYPASADSTEASLDFAVHRAAGGAPIVSFDRSVTVAGRGALDVASLPLTGLPPGSYELRVTARVDGRETTRTAPFEMGTFDALAAREPVIMGAASEQRVYERYFAPERMTDSATAVIVGSMEMTPPGGTVPDYASELSGDARRRFLARYWAGLDPAPETPQHELLEEFIARVEHVNRNFSDRQVRRAGVFTDRGRIYLKYGEPDVRQLAPMTGNRGLEMWRYTRQRNLKFVFLDETGFDHFVLLTSNDPTEPGFPDWQDRLGNRDMIEQVSRF